jgi:uncharacterized protein (TIGR00661 family)
VKVLYAVQGTGNGHVSRAREIVPILSEMAETDVLVSGVEHEVELPFTVKYSYSGYGFVFGTSGGIDYFKTIRQNSFLSLFKELRSAPVKEYDLVINDFEPVTAWACKLKGIPCISLSHQAGVIHPKSPKAKGSDPFAWLVLRYYAPARHRYGFHFKAYGERVFTPVIRKRIREAKPTKGDHYTVYLPAYGRQQLIEVLGQLRNTTWHVFSKRCKSKETAGNVVFHPIDQKHFIQALSSGTGFLCGAGFEGPAEALFLGKKVAVVPMTGQYEQHLNAAAISEFGVPVIPKLNTGAIQQLKDWISEPSPPRFDFPDETKDILKGILHDFSSGRIR